MSGVQLVQNLGNDACSDGAAALPDSEPEAFLHRTNHPRWSREPQPEEGQGVALFRNAIDQLRMSPP